MATEVPVVAAELPVVGTEDDGGDCLAVTSAWGSVDTGEAALLRAATA
jgi:hypothetical protein